MSTNFYVGHWGPDEEPLSSAHIGKRSVGWQFLFHATPTTRSREEWAARIAEAGVVTDENGQELSPGEFWDAVEATRTGRPGGDAPRSQAWGPIGARTFQRDPEHFTDDQGWCFCGHDFC